MNIFDSVQGNSNKSKIKAGPVKLIQVRIYFQPILDPLQGDRGLLILFSEQNGHRWHRLNCNIVKMAQHRIFYVICSHSFSHTQRFTS